MSEQDQEQETGQRIFSREEVLAVGFEARCIGPDGARYLYCEGSGLRVDPRTQATILVTDPATLPDGPWTATRFGRQQLAEAGREESAAHP